MPRPGRRIRLAARPRVSKAIMRAVPTGRRRDHLPRPRRAGRPPASSTGAQMEPIRRKIQYIFQDPYSSLNPRMTVGDILAEPFAIHGIGTDATRRAAAVRLLEMVGLERAAPQPLSAQLLRRPAAAHRHRARAGAAARPASSATSRSRRSTSRSRRRSSTSSRICRRRSASPTCSSRTTSRSSTTSPTASP